VVGHDVEYQSHAVFVDSSHKTIEVFGAHDFGGKREVDNDILRHNLKPWQVVIDLVNFEKSRRPESASYEGICW
jgi:hypothetical protein